MTRDEIVASVANRLGDASTEFQAVVNEFFDDVLAELASEELIPSLKQLGTFTVDQDTRTYDVKDETGATDYPIRVLDLRVPDWGYFARVMQAENNEEFDRYRFDYSQDYRGKWRLWRTYPNVRTLEVWPPAGSEDAGVDAEIVYLAPPAQITGETELTELDRVDVPWLKYGMIAYGAPFRDETIGDIEQARTLFEAGKRRLFGRIFNSAPGRISITDY